MSRANALPPTNPLARGKCLHEIGMDKHCAACAKAGANVMDDCKRETQGTEWEDGDECYAENLFDPADFPSSQVGKDGVEMCVPSKQKSTNEWYDKIRAIKTLIKCYGDERACVTCNGRFRHKHPEEILKEIHQRLNEMPKGTP